VGLVLKTMNTKPNNPEWQAFLKECQTDKRIQLITETLDRPEVLGLINACDAYVSLHRAEGFGRTLAEAMLLGKPVIATNYSGNVDFMSEKNTKSINYKLIPIGVNEYQWCDLIDHATWASVEIADAACKLKMIANGELKISKSDRLNASRHFSIEFLSMRILSFLVGDRCEI
jgi:glycosyltransferase involved in cell wall biosynthesis